MKNWQITFCPSDGNRNNPNAARSYRFRHCIDACAINWRRPVLDADFAYPAQQIIFHEWKDWHGEKLGLWNTTPGTRYVNCAFVDGHVKVYTAFSGRGPNNDPNWFDRGHGWDVSKGYDH